jgi:hypothetical protein
MLQKILPVAAVVRVKHLNPSARKLLGKEFASQQERGMNLVYDRWADGQNMRVILKLVVSCLHSSKSLSKDILIIWTKGVLSGRAIPTLHKRRDFRPDPFVLCALVCIISTECTI